MSELPKVGFIGVGTIAEALITGMCAEGEQRARFLLSPRNAAIAKHLAERFSFVKVAASNQAVVDGTNLADVVARHGGSVEPLANDGR